MKNTLLGFGDFFSSDSVGAADRGYGTEIGFEPQDPKNKGQKAPTKPYQKPPTNPHTKPHAQALRAGRNVLNKSVKKTMVAVVHLAKPPVKAPNPVVQQRIKTLMGIAAATLPPAQAAKMKAAKEKLDKAAAKLKKAADLSKRGRQNLAQHAITTKKANNELAKKLLDQRHQSKVMRTPVKQRSKIHIVGALVSDPTIEALLDHPVLGEEAAEMILGYLGEDAPPPDEGAYSSEDTGDYSTAPDASLEASLQSSEADANNALDNLDIDLTKLDKVKIDEFFTEERRKAMGGIVYDERLGRPDGFAGSAHLFTRETDRYIVPTSMPMGIDGIEHNGYVWGRFNAGQKEQGIPWGETLPSNQWNRIRGRHKHSAVGGGLEFDKVDEAEVVNNNRPDTNPSVPDPAPLHNYGPIVGNPAMSDWAGMRMDDKGVFFWLPNEVPKWLTADLALAAAVTAKAAKDAEAAQKKIDDAMKLKMQADRDAEKAKADFDNAQAEAKALSEGKVAEAATATAADTALVEQQKADTAQQAAETTAQTQQLEQQKQMFEMQMARMQQMQAQQPQGGGGYEPEYADEGGGEEYGPPEQPMMDDGEPAPGGDMMQDAGGEGYQESEPEPEAE